MREKHSSYVLRLAAVALACAAMSVTAPGTAVASPICPIVNSATGKVTPAPGPSVNWSGCDLHGADLAGGEMNGDNLAGANLSDANLQGTDLTSATLAGAGLAGATLSGATLDGVKSGSVSGTPATLPAHWALGNGYLVGPDANLTGADLTGMNLTGDDLDGAILTGAHIAGTALAGADLDDVTTGGITGQAASLPALWRQTVGYLAGPTANLQGADLTGADLTGVSLHLAIIQDANLAGANVTGTQFSGAYMHGLRSGGLTGAPASLSAQWSLINGYLIGPFADLSGAKLSNADLSGATLLEVTSGGVTGTPILPAGWTLTDGYLVGPVSNLTRANLAGADLAGADLTNATLFQANLAGANLSGADLSGTYLVQANFTGTDLTNAALGTALISGVRSGGITGLPASLPAEVELADGYLLCAGAMLAGAHLNGADLSGDYLPNANLAGAQLAGANLTGASLGSANLTGADLEHADLTNIYLGSANLTKADLAHATVTNDIGNAYTGVIWSDTTCPDGTNSSRHLSGCFGPFEYGFAGFAAPLPGSTIARSVKPVTVRFVLTGPSGHPLSQQASQSLTGRVRVTLTGPGIKPVIAPCAGTGTARGFTCSLRVPGGVRAGQRFRYQLTASEKLLTAWLIAPADGKAANPATIHFR